MGNELSKVVDDFICLLRSWIELDWIGLDWILK